MSTTLLSTITLPEMTDLIRREFATVAKMVVPASKQLFISDPIGKGQGNTKRYEEFDIETFGRRKNEGEKAKKASAGVGYHVIATKKRIAREIDITQEMRDENRYPEVQTNITSLTHFCPQRIELDGTHLFTFASATSYTNMDGETVTISVGDGLALAAAAHTLKFSDSTYRNRVAGDPIFSPGALTAAEKLMVTDILSNFGETRVMNFNTIVTGNDPDTVKAVKKVMMSSGDPEAAHAGVYNADRSAYRHVILPYLATTATSAHDSTKERYWFIVAAGQGTSGWQAYYTEWEAPHSKMPGEEDYSADVWTYGVRAGYSHRAVTGRGIIACLPTS